MYTYNIQVKISHQLFLPVLTLCKRKQFSLGHVLVFQRSAAPGPSDSKNACDAEFKKKKKKKKKKLHRMMQRPEFESWILVVFVVDTSNH